MKLLRSRLVFALCCWLLFARAFLKISRTAAQNEPEAANQSVVSLQVTANNEIAAQNVEAHHVHLNLLRSAKSAHVHFNDPEIECANPDTSTRCEMNEPSSAA